MHVIQYFNPDWIGINNKTGETSAQVPNSEDAMSQMQRRMFALVDELIVHLRSSQQPLWHNDTFRSTEHGFYFHQSASFQMHDSTQVRDEVQNLLLNYVHPSPRSSISQIQGAVRFQLYFQTGLPHTLFTGKGIKAVDKMPIQIAIKDSNNHIVTSGPMSTLKIKIVVVNGDFSSDGKAMWSKEEFSRHIMPERCGKRPLLTGELEVRMQGGVACIVDATFTDNSSWTRSGKFRLGAIVSDGRYAGERVQEAITEAFKVKDGRLESSQKDCPPSLDDEVCRLKKIQKDGAFHKKLTDNGIVTVQDFLRALVMDPNKLRILLGKGMSNKWWEATLEHASQCALGYKRYSYSVVGEEIDLVFNSIFELIGVKIYGLYQPADDLSPSLMGKLNHYKKLAYINPGDIFELRDPPLESLPWPLCANVVPSVPGSNLSDCHNSPHPATLQDEAANVSCRIVSNRQGFICIQRSASFATNKCSTNAANEQNMGSPSLARTDSMEWSELIAEMLQSPAPSSSRKWVQLSAAFKLVFIKQSARRKARIAHPDHQVQVT